MIFAVIRNDIKTVHSRKLWLIVYIGMLHLGLGYFDIKKECLSLECPRYSNLDD